MSLFIGQVCHALAELDSPIMDLRANGKRSFSVDITGLVGHPGRSHVADHGIRHVYITPRSPQLNGKIERSHHTDQQEFYQLLSYKGDADLERRLTEWEAFYNFHRPHGAFGGKTPYEALRERLQ